MPRINGNEIRPGAVADHEGGQAAASSSKPATLDNGLRITAPPFVGGSVVVSAEGMGRPERA